MIEKINEVLQNKKNVLVNIVNGKLTISVFSLLEKNLHNVKKINFVIHDVKFLSHQTEIAHEFEINPADILFNSYDITEKNKLQHFSKARSMHDFIQIWFNEQVSVDYKEELLARTSGIGKAGGKDMLDT